MALHFTAWHAACGGVGVVAERLPSARFKMILESGLTVTMKIRCGDMR